MIFFASDVQWCCLAVQGSPPVTQDVVSVESSCLLVCSNKLCFICLPCWFIDELEACQGNRTTNYMFCSPPETEGEVKLV